MEKMSERRRCLKGEDNKVPPDAGFTVPGFLGFSVGNFMVFLLVSGEGGGLHPRQ